MQPEALHASPNALAPDYSRFRVAERLLLTGHSHQAWPDCSLDGQVRAWTDAAEAVDGKWERAFAVAERLRRWLARRLDDSDGTYTLAPSTHDLLVRWLSALSLERRPRLVTTDGEFHTVRRQLTRLEEEGIEVVRMPSHPVDELSVRLASAVDERTAAVVVSAVLFGGAEIVAGLAEVARACDRCGTELLVDAYHAINVVPFSIPAEGLASAYVVGGGYKYLQMGEGNCFLRAPAGSALRPVVTGWFAEFDTMAEPAAAGRVTYAPGAARFAGSTYDPTSHYRAVEVADFFDRRELSLDLLHAVSRHQVGLLAAGFDALDLPPWLVSRDRSLPPERRGGFLALRSPGAGELSQALARRGLATDFRGDVLRLGPAPYLCDRQLETALGLLAEAVREMAAAAVRP